MTSGRSSNRYATYVDLDTAAPPTQHAHPAPPPPPAYAPPVAYFRPEPPRTRRVRRRIVSIVSLVGTAIVVLLAIGVGQAYLDERKEKAQACTEVAAMVQALPSVTAGTPQQWAALLTAPADPQIASELRYGDAHNRRFASRLLFHPKLKAALIGIADDLDGLADVRFDTQGDVAERAARGAGLTQSLDEHLRAAQTACA
ncbi:hypothetical protein ACPPVO_39120 [Dactylosporangium sp. McL0621]|uniref:hypothetical protein n=1 Tax=Dactylosporangium sp. McL0621 TaxID=3415678 RepID=UPI003CF9739E